MKGFIVLWAIGAMGVAGLLAAGFGPPWVSAPDWVHVVAHLLLFGSLAWIIDRRGRWQPPATALVVLAVGLGVELAQVAASRHLSLRELGFDMVVDGLGAMAGLAVGSRPAAARAIGAWLHPVWVVPVGLWGAFYAGLRQPTSAVWWAGCASLCWLPAAGVWFQGVRQGWFRDMDLTERTDRPALFALACSCAALFLVLASILGAPEHVLLVAWEITITSVALFALTVLGFKVSGHVTVPLVLAVAVAPWSSRGLAIFLIAAALLSWGRVRSLQHRPLEVAGAWALAAVLAAPLLLAT